MSIAVLRDWSAGDGRSGQRLYMFCPACDDLHCVEVAAEGAWTWDGNLDAPTVNPSIKVEGVQWNPDDAFYKPSHASVAPGGQICCHSFVRAGTWQFLGDCTHTMAGQTVPLPPIPEGLLDG